MGASDDDLKRFTEAGLLDDLDSREAREARVQLLAELEGDGVPLEELKRAVDQGRLAFLPVDRVLAEEPKYTARELAELAGVSLEYLLAGRQSAGFARPEPDEKAFGELDLEAIRITGQLLAAGMPEEGMLEVTRVLGRGLAQGAEAIRMLLAGTFMRAGVTELELAMRNAEAASELLPQLSPLLMYLLRLHLREQTRAQAISQAELAAGVTPRARQVFVGFADMVGFTRLGERLDVTELGGLVGRMEALALEAQQPPTRLIKTIGDAAMFVAPAAEPLVETALELTERIEHSDDLPPLRIGLAGGVALSREGDWYGRPVNLASRVTAVARPGSVLAAPDVREAAGNGTYRWSPAGDWRLKGFKGRTALFRVRRAPA